MTNVTDYFREVFHLKSTTDYEKSADTIQEGIYLKGYNVWMLIASAILTCIGLDTNSPAVIIGAMLISPLMGPILGIGFGIAVEDKDMMFRGIRNFTIAVVISIITSAFYFTITPLGSVTTEIIARTKPTFLDALIGFFGGVAGIVAASRKGVTTAIPGVAIATALMPPLCTAGFGLVSGNINYFFGAFYLFLINTFFISFATFLIVKFLRFPIKTYIDDKLKRKAFIYVLIFSILLTAPSFYFLYTTVLHNREKSRINQFLESSFQKPDYDILNWQLQESDSVRYLKVYIVGKYIPPDKIDTMEVKLLNSGIDNTKIEIVQAFSFDENIDELSNYMKEKLASDEEYGKIPEKKLMGMLDSIATIKYLEQKDSIKIIEIKNESGILFPELSNISYTNRLFIPGDSVNIKLVIAEWKKYTNSRNKFEEFVKQKITDSILFIHRNVR
ncbi:MAG: TIGR00341 family protein [Ignavibacteria bacterium]|nr:TIGR00341 family protein [Ignavibacteria bacterium]